MAHAVLVPLTCSVKKFSHCGSLHNCSQIVMGTRGMSAIANLVIGSTANQIVHLAEVPVTLQSVTSDLAVCWADICSPIRPVTVRQP